MGSFIYMEERETFSTTWQIVYNFETDKYNKSQSRLREKYNDFVTE